VLVLDTVRWKMEKAQSGGLEGAKRGESEEKKKTHSKTPCGGRVKTPKGGGGAHLWERKGRPKVPGGEKKPEKKEGEGGNKRKTDEYEIPTRERS